MAKIYEALELAYKNKKNLPPSDSPPSLIPARSVPSIDLEKEAAALYKNIEALLQDKPKKIVQFIGVRKGEGVSTITRELARFAAINVGKSVLLLDADRLAPEVHHHFDVDSQGSWIDVLANGKDLVHTLSRVGGSQLYISPSYNSASYTPEIFDAGRVDSFWSLLRERFDLVLIDSPPFSDSPDGLAFAPQSDGVVIVVESEKTRWKAAEHLKQSILKVGGRLLGVIVNKRRYYIPPFFFKYL